ncbi:MAG TPA: glutamate--tRNA ligase [bacterium]|jgi:glutamyl-tRNA synthetase
MGRNLQEEIINPRVRFAPSPTGDLHIGSARTALFNYLFAKRYGGKFILRIEDTDKIRSTDESLKNLVDGLKWLGIMWDEGPDPRNPSDLSKEVGDFSPYLQSARREEHRAAAVKLFESGKAYECDCPPQEETGQSKCKCAGRQDELKNVPMDKKCLKFRIPPGPPVVVHDLIKGEVLFKRDELQDFIIVRTDGYPTYNFVVVVDDASMDITHVIRGDDHLPNTPKQILIYEALELDVPSFAHIPLIHGSDGTRMSKRHGTVGVKDFRDQGFLSEAFVNYIALLGWNDETDEEIYSLNDLEKAFRLEQVNSAPAMFDEDKLLWFNGKYIRGLSADDLYSDSLPFLAKWVDPADVNGSTREWLTGILGLYQERVQTLGELSDALEYFFVDPTDYSDEELGKAKVTGDAFNQLLELKKKIPDIEWTKPGVEKFLRDFVAEKEIGLGKLVHPLRLVVTGRTATPGIFDTLYYVGKEPVIRRLEHFLANYQPPD